MTVARRFIAGSVYYTGLRPGGTAEYRRSWVKAEGPTLLILVGTIRRSPAHHIDNTGVGVVLVGDLVRERLRARRFAAEIALATEISTVTSGTKSNLNTSTGDKSPAYFRSSLRDTPPPRRR
jgi:hypothetical protein